MLRLSKRVVLHTSKSCPSFSDLDCEASTKLRRSCKYRMPYSVLSNPIVTPLRAKTDPSLLTHRSLRDRLTRLKHNLEIQRFVQLMCLFFLLVCLHPIPHPRCLSAFTFAWAGPTVSQVPLFNAGRCKPFLKLYTRRLAHFSAAYCLCHYEVPFARPNRTFPATASLCNERSIRPSVA